MREQHKQRTSAAIAEAALGLFADRGYDSVTLAEVAAAAGIGERTLYRYFADKEDLLFAEDGQLRDALTSAVEEQGAIIPPLEAVHRASADLVAALENRHDELRRRNVVIASAAALASRERAKHAAWEQAIGATLHARGVDSAKSRLVGRIAVACFHEALSRWLEATQPERPLATELDTVFSELHALATE